MTTAAKQVGWAWLVLLVVGCGPRIEESETAVSGSTGNEPEAVTTSGRETTYWETDAEDPESSTSEEGGSFIVDPMPTNCGLPPGLLASCECDLAAQNCDTDDACKPRTSTLDGVWDTTACSPLPPDPSRIGEPCEKSFSPFSGIDSCEAGAMCWEVGRDGIGTCIEFCGALRPEQACSSPTATCAVGNEGSVAVCLPSCNPLEPSCGERQGCYPTSALDFGCVLEGTPLSMTSWLIHPFCPPGSFALGPSVEKGCVEDEPCCAAFCDLNAADGCEPEETCVPYFDDLTEVDASLHAVGQCVAT